MRRRLILLATIVCTSVVFLIVEERGGQVSVASTVNSGGSSGRGEDQRQGGYVRSAHATGKSERRNRSLELAQVKQNYSRVLEYPIVPTDLIETQLELARWAEFSENSPEFHEAVSRCVAQWELDLSRPCRYSYKVVVERDNERRGMGTIVSSQAAIVQQGDDDDAQPEYACRELVQCELDALELREPPPMLEEWENVVALKVVGRMSSWNRSMSVGQRARYEFLIAEAERDLAGLLHAASTYHALDGDSVDWNTQGVIERLTNQRATLKFLDEAEGG